MTFGNQSADRSDSRPFGRPTGALGAGGQRADDSTVSGSADFTRSSSDRRSGSWGSGDPRAVRSVFARPDDRGSTDSAAESVNRCPPQAGREPDRLSMSAEPEAGREPDRMSISDEPNLGGPGISEELATTGAPAPHESLEPDPDDPGGETALLAKERDEYREALVRLQADFENYKKRVAKQQEELRDRAAEALVEKLLPVLDTADLALAHGGGEDIKQIYSALFAVLEREGLERIDDPGSPFDPTLHDAVAHEPGDGHTQEVAEVMRAGYRWRGRVLRPAMVKVRG